MTEHTTDALAAALAAAQGEMKNAALNKVNPHFKSKYSDLPTIRNTVTPVLSKHGIAVVQFTRVNEHGFLLITRLMHGSGGYIEGEYPLPNIPDQPQKIGSAMTYARRNALAAISGIAAEEDDDAEAATDRGNGASKAAPASRAAITAPKVQPPQQPAQAPQEAPGKRALDWPSIQARNVPAEQRPQALANGMTECIRLAEDATELAELEAANKTALDWLAKAAPAGHTQIKHQIRARLDELANGPMATAGG